MTGARSPAPARRAGAPTAGGTAKATGTRSGTASGGARPGAASNGRTSASAATRSRAERLRVPAGRGRERLPCARTGTASRPATTSNPAPDTGQNGTEKRGLLRLGRAKAEPEPQDDVPATKVVRQQPVRQARSKRSGKR